MSTAFCFYILTFAEEFRGISVDHPTLAFLEDDEPMNVTIIEENLLNSPNSEVISWSQFNDRITTTTSHQQIIIDVYSKIKPKRKIIKKSKSLSYIYDCKDFKIDFIKETKNIISNPLNSEQEETTINNKSLIIADSRKLADLTLSLMLAAFFEILHCFSMFLNDNLRKYTFEKNFNVWQLLYLLFLFIRWFPFFFVLFLFKMYLIKIKFKKNLFKNLRLFLWIIASFQNLLIDDADLLNSLRTAAILFIS